MILAIDVGNTHLKAALFDASGNVLPISATEALTMLGGEVLVGVVVSAVTDIPPHLASILSQRTDVILVSGLTPIPIGNAYVTPATLGTDRLCAAIGAWSINTGVPLMVMDAGTCLKYEYVSADGTYLGGAIAPGLRMRLRSMHEGTAKLPLLEAEPDAPMIGTSTATAMQSGAQFGMLCEMEGRIARFLHNHPAGKVLITGGDHMALASQLNYPIFADPFLVLRGLYEIHIHNRRA